MHFRPLVVSLLLTSALFAATGGRPALATKSALNINFQESDIIPGELIVGMKSGTRISSLKLPDNSFIVKSNSTLHRLNAAVIAVPSGEERNYIAEIRKIKGVLFVEPNYRVEASVIPNDFYWNQQYGPAQIEAPAAWDITTGSNSVTLAVIDSGLDSSHPEFSGRIVAGYDFIQNDFAPQDQCGHGTHVAGIAAASGNNMEGIAGINWNVNIMPLRVLDRYCSGSTADVAEALVWAVEHGATVINLSLGTLSPSTLMENGAYYAYTHGAAIFAAAGNLGTSPVAYPAAYPWVMAVGATNAFGLRAGYSNTGTALDLMAPGDGIFSTLPTYKNFLYNLSCPNGPYPCGKNIQYDSLSGTSMASAHAAGAGALLAGLPAYNTPDKIYLALTSTALDMDAPGRDDHTGYGLIRLASALAFTPVIVPTATPSISMQYDVVNSISCANLVQYNWRDATVSGTPLLFLPGSNSGYAQINSLPFNVSLGGQTYTSLTAHSNGYLAMGNNTSIIADNFIIPGISSPNNFIAPFWDDLTSLSNGVLYAATLGSAPDREFVIEWTEMQRVNASGSLLQFEIVLFENNGEILVQYHTLKGSGADGSSATVGVEYADGLAGREYSYNKAGALQQGMALLFMPYNTGDVPPSGSCSSFTTPVDSDGGFYDAPPFCLTIPQDALQHPATLQIQPLVSAPAMPSSFLDLHHYADITLSYSPAPPLSPIPEAYVCYHYTNQDVLQAGGHPTNLFITAYDATRKKWDALSTSVDSNQRLLIARAPHFSIYGVATFNHPQELPVTGGYMSVEFQVVLAASICLAISLAVIAWTKKRKNLRNLKH